MGWRRDRRVRRGRRAGRDSGSVRQAGPGFVFLETSARVGGAFIVDTIEAATGINLWREWAKLEIAGEHGGAPFRRTATTTRASC